MSPEDVLHLGSLGLGGAQRKQYRAAYLPAAEFAAAWEGGLLDVTVHRAHADYRRALETTLRRFAAQPGDVISVVPLDLPGLLAYAAREGRDPASRDTRLAYSDSLHDAGRDIPWPPARNGPCWCGSDHKYKKCCGAPAFLAAETPDPAALLLRIELDDVEPPVWRRVLIPSGIRLDQVHDVIQDAMGWEHAHAYLFEQDGTVLLDPDVAGPDEGADTQRLISLANEVGDRFTYVYDLGDHWSHTVVVEEIREAGDDNAPVVVKRVGDCPPEDCGGAARYLELTRAWHDPTDPEHEEAVDWLGDPPEADEAAVIAAEQPSLR